VATGLSVLPPAQPIDGVGFVARTIHSASSNISERTGRTSETRSPAVLRHVQFRMNGKLQLGSSGGLPVVNRQTYFERVSRQVLIQPRWKLTVTGRSFPLRSVEYTTS
jgi:hypothetical protein